MSTFTDALPANVTPAGAVNDGARKVDHTLDPTYRLTTQPRDAAAADRNRAETVRRLKNHRAGRRPDDDGNGNQK